MCLSNASRATRGSPAVKIASERNDPERNFSPNFWLNIAGQATDKVSGDRHTAGACSVAWGCAGGLNTEYRPDGYFYKVNVGATGLNPLNIDVYDPTGRHIGTLETPQRATSLAFGGPDRKTLFIGARSSLYAIRTSARGQ